MKRIVILPVYDSITELVFCEGASYGYEGRHWWKQVPVPPDNQLARDLDGVTRSTLNSLDWQDERDGGLGHDGLALRDMALRLREAAGLEEA